MPFREFEIKDFNGMTTNIPVVNKNDSDFVKNLNVHTKPGALVLRDGYQLKYAQPTIGAREVAGYSDYLTFANFYERKTTAAGKEVTVQIQKARIQSEITGVTDTIDMLVFWVRPYWDGTQWVDEWRWLNETVITKITIGQDATYKSYYEIAGGATEHLGTEIVGWTIYNATQDLYAKVLTAKESGGNTQINITNYNDDWDVDDIVYLFKSYIPIDYLTEMYNATASEITINNLLSDLRIGFGGKENRVGVAVGYRKKYFNVDSVDFTNLHADITDAAIEAFATINEVILELYTFIGGEYGLELTESSTTTLAAGEYYFKLTGLLDDVSELLLATNNIVTATDADIEVRPYLKLGTFNRRITKFRVYYSTDNGSSYYFFKEMNITNSEEFSASGFVISEDMDRLILKEAAAVELYNAANVIGDDTNALTGLTEFRSGTVLSKDTSQVPTGGGTYSAKLLAGAVDGSGRGVSVDLTIAGIGAIERSKTYTVSLYVYGTIAKPVSCVFLHQKASVSDTVVQNITTASTWEKLDFNMTIPEDAPAEPDTLVFMFETVDHKGKAVYFDILSIKESSGAGLLTAATTMGAEISANMGYVPTMNFMKDWEQCLVFNGRAYYLNPYIDKKYYNFIMISQISSAYMYDAVTAARFLELEKMDGANSIGMALLSNYNILVLKDDSLMIVDPDTNRNTDFGYGKGCVSRQSIVEFQGVVVWAGADGVYVLSASMGQKVKDILESTIRDKYIGLPNKDKIIGIRDKYSVYLMRLPNLSDRYEYVVSNRKWVVYQRYLFAEVFRNGHNNILWFMNNGNIYEVPVTYFPYDAGGGFGQFTGDTFGIFG